jgi:3-dehydroquinate dehydratase type I
MQCLRYEERIFCWSGVVLKVSSPFVTRDGNCKVITSVFAETPEDFFAKLNSVPDGTERIFEIRFDLFADHETGCLGEITGYMKKREIPYIFTYRTGDVEDAREKYIFALKGNAIAADLDVALKELSEDLAGRIPVILSYHGSGKWDLLDVLRMMEKTGADSYKLANYYENLTGFTEDLALISGFRQRIEKPLSFIPMGKGNGILRMVSACLVSDFAYSKMDTESAPGQLSYNDMSSMINTCMRIRQQQ